MCWTIIWVQDTIAVIRISIQPREPTLAGKTYFALVNENDLCNRVEVLCWTGGVED